MMEHQHTAVQNRTYLVVWAVLVVLTLVSVAISQTFPGTVKIWAVLAIASIQATLVLTILMHLKHEARMFSLGILTLFVMLAIFMGLTFTDVLYR